MSVAPESLREDRVGAGSGMMQCHAHVVAIFYPFSQFCEINISLLSLQKQPNTAPSLFQRGVEYGKYATKARREIMHGSGEGLQGEAGKHTCTRSP